MKNFIQNGGRLTYTNATGSDIASGALVVVGALLCIATAAIANGATGVLATEGVFELPKATHASSKAFTQGENLTFDVSEGLFEKGATVPAAGDIVGVAVAWEAAGSTAATASIYLSNKPGTITPAG